MWAVIIIRHTIWVCLFSPHREKKLSKFHHVSDLECLSDSLFQSEHSNRSSRSVQQNKEVEFVCTVYLFCVCVSMDEEGLMSSEDCF